MKMFDAITIEQECGCGKVFVSVLCADDVVKRVECHGAKIGTCMSISMTSNQNLINEMLANGSNIKDIIGKINNLHCNRPRKTGIDDNGDTSRWVYSCVDAISHSLQEFLKYKKNQQKVA
jgi:hypothetical protein